MYFSALPHPTHPRSDLRQPYYRQPPPQRADVDLRGSVGTLAVAPATALVRTLQVEGTDFDDLAVRRLRLRLVGRRTLGVTRYLRGGGRLLLEVVTQQRHSLAGVDLNRHVVRVSQDRFRLLRELKQEGLDLARLVRNGLRHVVPLERAVV